VTILLELYVPITPNILINKFGLNREILYFYSFIIEKYYN
jgi:hypothetical protein